MASGFTYFLVDDDIDDTFLFREVLSEVAPQVHLFTAANGQEALDSLLAGTHPTPDLIFLDLNMPRMDGKECLGLLKSNEKLAHIPVIIYTTSSHSRDIEETMLQGAISFITKPSHVSELKTILRALAGTSPQHLKRTLQELSSVQGTFIIC